MSIKGTWTKQVLVWKDHLPDAVPVTQGVAFEPIPEEDPKPLYRVTCSLGPGLDFGCLLNAEEAEAGLKALEADGWKKQ